MAPHTWCSPSVSTQDDSLSCGAPTRPAESPRNLGRPGSRVACFVLKGLAAPERHPDVTIWTTAAVAKRTSLAAACGSSIERRSTASTHPLYNGMVRMRYNGAPEVPISPAMRRFLIFVAAMVPVTVLVFLYASDFLGSWDGRVVSLRPPERDNPASYQVLIVEPDGTRLERAWRADLVRTLGLPADPLAIPPDTIPKERPSTRKSAYSLYFELQEQNDGAWTVVPTTSPSSFGVAMLVFLAGIAVRNMIVAGSPFSIEPQGLTLPKAQAPSGQIARNRGSRPRKGPPPPRPRKGSGRR